MRLNRDRGLLSPGRIFLYYGPRGRWFRRGIASAKVLMFSETFDVVHIRTYVDRDGQGALAVDVGHMPISWSTFASSVFEVSDAVRPPEALPSTVQDWKDRHGRGEVGAFTVPIWEAESLAWSTAMENAPVTQRQELWIEYAFPKRSADGRFSRVEVAVAQR